MSDTAALLYKLRAAVALMLGAESGYCWDAGSDRCVQLHQWVHHKY
jgi:hypothetical protein